MLPRTQLQLDQFLGLHFGPDGYPQYPRRFPWENEMADYYIHMSYGGAVVQIPVSVGEEDSPGQRIGDAIAYYKTEGFSLPANVSGANNAAPSFKEKMNAPSASKGDGCPDHGTEKLKPFPNGKGKRCTFTVSKKEEAGEGWRQWKNDEGYDRWSCGWKS